MVSWVSLSPHCSHSFTNLFTCPADDFTVCVQKPYHLGVARELEMNGDHMVNHWKKN